LPSAIEAKPKYLSIDFQIPNKCAPKIVLQAWGFIINAGYYF